VWTTPRLLAAMSLAALVNLTAYPLTSGLMPYIARDVFHLDQRGLGLLAASFAMGSFIGSMTVSLIGTRIQPARAMLVSGLVWFVSLLGFIATRDVPAAMVLLVSAGTAQSISMVTLSILLLATSEQRFRGRIMGVRMLCIYTLPLGLLAAGFLIPNVGYEATAVLFILTGLVVTLEIGVSWRSELIRRDAVANNR
jgi:MFS family permease